MWSVHIGHCDVQGVAWTISFYGKGRGDRAARRRPESADAPSRRVSLIHSRAFAASAIGYTRPSKGMNMAMNFVVRLIHSTSVTIAKLSQSNM